ncbi:hypothetical protein BT63DRAFT_428114 [Microthyrium microscopicum]|uniref:Zn(2)-C6 fungal-type domain-containing protein n=1 Tax=Microthyrium microscopicum TaxID=703497 RepID=A0A6A6U3X9_9PEZI|nr:hypothetical protein BT63DRAFT_428114 [Microthyrium microscopicum]
MSLPTPNKTPSPNDHKNQRKADESTSVQPTSMEISSNIQTPSKTSPRHQASESPGPFSSPPISMSTSTNPDTPSRSILDSSVEPDTSQALTNLTSGYKWPPDPPRTEADRLFEEFKATYVPKSELYTQIVPEVTQFIEICKWLRGFIQAGAIRQPCVTDEWFWLYMAYRWHTYGHSAWLHDFHAIGVADVEQFSKTFAASGWKEAFRACLPEAEVDWANSLFPDSNRLSGAVEDANSRYQAALADPSQCVLNEAALEAIVNELPEDKSKLAIFHVLEEVKSRQKAATEKIRQVTASSSNSSSEVFPNGFSWQLANASKGKKTNAAFAQGQVCARCRAKKKKCDRARPQCGPCVSRGFACNYDGVDLEDEKIAAHKEPDAKACLRCKSKKLRCDGAKPACRACNLEGRNCFYDDENARLGSGDVNSHQRAFSSFAQSSKKRRIEDTLAPVCDEPSSKRSKTLNPEPQSSSVDASKVIRGKSVLTSWQNIEGESSSSGTNLIEAQKPIVRNPRLDQEIGWMNEDNIPDHKTYVDYYHTRKGARYFRTMSRTKRYKLLDVMDKDEFKWFDLKRHWARCHYGEHMKVYQFEAAIDEKPVDRGPFIMDMVKSGWLVVDGLPDDDEDDLWTAGRPVKAPVGDVVAATETPPETARMETLPQCSSTTIMLIENTAATDAVTEL